MRRVLLALLLLGLAHGAAALTPLRAADVPALLAAGHGTRVIALWSLDCPYCADNLRQLDRLRRAHPALELILVATDGGERRAELEQRLDALDLAGLPGYFYADAMPERLNAKLDPAWGGELPRTLLIQRDGRRAWSGALEAKQLGEIAAAAL